MHKFIEVTMLSGDRVFVNPEQITYIAPPVYRGSPTLTRINFTGDRSNSIDVMESYDRILKQIFYAEPYFNNMENDNGE